ncbi:34415_t:CDS:2 [Gigaspora margarita]|uniref:34415_t:CDS:1 n=1 Tax=Gigaspora margarita TaxID=4874 RepID=A0ABN7UPM7_GIGMA|nr:34415_t:CDS:2 [Gigaspora margarita]
MTLQDYDPLELWSFRIMFVQDCDFSGSQRYPKVPVFTDDHCKVGINFDFMQVSIGELYKLPNYVKALKILYCEDSEEAKDDYWMQE